ncbi:MAG: DUF6173 family protein, partial [Eubacteriales bacterium]|nr:DUF6173 family protein [Eubacteriales bacterium]
MDNFQSINSAIAATTRRMNEMVLDVRKQKEFDSGFASVLCQQIVTEVKSFNNSLDSENEVGIQLVSYGERIQFYLTAIGCKDPYLIYFYGVMEDETPVQLIQHVSQLSFVMIKLKKL